MIFLIIYLYFSKLKPDKIPEQQSDLSSTFKYYTFIKPPDSVFQFHTKFDKHLLDKTQNKYYTYINQAADTSNKVISCLQIRDTKLITQFFKAGYEIIPFFSNNSQYIITSNKLILDNTSVNSFELIENFNLSFSYHTTIKYRKIDTKNLIKRFFKIYDEIIAKVLFSIVVLSLLIRHIPHRIQSKNSKDLTIVFCSSNGHILTPIPSFLPTSIICHVRKHCYYPVEHYSTHNVFKDNVTMLYKIIFQPVNKDIICCVIFRIPFDMLSFECETTAVGTCFSNSSVDDRQPVDAKLRFDKNNLPSASFSFNFQREDMNLVLKNNTDDSFALGRQAHEFERYVTIQQSILHEGLKSKPSKSKFLSLLKSAYERLNYTAIVIVMVTEESEVEVLAKFCRVSILSDYYNKLIEEVKSGKFKDGDIVLRTVGSYRTGSHTFTVESTKYFFFVSARADSNIIRSIEPNIHAILTMLVAHNHTHFISSKIMDEIRVLDKVWTDKNFAVFECVDGKLDWMVGMIGDRKLDKKTFDYIYSRISEPLNSPLGHVAKFVAPMWFTPYKRSVLLVNSQRKFDSLRNVTVLTCLMRDVSDIYSNSIYDDNKLNANLMGAVMFGFQRVEGEDCLLSFPNVLKNYLGETPPKSFSNLTKITESKVLNYFRHNNVAGFKLIKSDGNALDASSVPFGENGEFFIYPQRAYSKAYPAMMKTVLSSQNQGYSKDVRVAFLDLVRDRIISLGITPKIRPISDWDPPREIKQAPKCKRQIELLAGSLYRKHSVVFLNTVIEAVKNSMANIIVHVHEYDRYRPFMMNIQCANSVITIVMISLEDENGLIQHANVVMHAFDGINPTGHIFEWIYEKHERLDGLYSSTPGGVEPQKFSKSSLKLLIIPEQRMVVEKQLDAGYVDMAYIVKFEEPRWYYVRGRTLDGNDNILYGVCVLVPIDAIPNEIQPGKKATYARYLNQTFQKLNQSIPFDISQFMQALDLVTTSSI